MKMKTKMFWLIIVLMFGFAAFCFAATNSSVHHDNGRYSCIVCHESKLLPNGKVKIEVEKDCTKCHIVRCGQLR
jgi:YbbR domain-containing protein